MTKKYDTLVFIGRFQPIHNAHLEIIRRATELARQIVIIVGSANQPRTYKNPFTSFERELLIKNAVSRLGDSETAIRVEHNQDTIYNDQAWAIRVQALVNKHTAGLPKTGIIGHTKDETSFYLKMFPQWQHEEVELIEPLHATDIRDLYFKHSFNSNFIKNVVPGTTYNFLMNFRRTEEFAQIVREREFISSYKKQYESLPYPPVFVTTDAVVICSGHVLMIRRRSEPGRGLWALPGGFLNAETDSSVEACMLRELREETGIKVPAPVLRGSIQANRVFDAVARSTRGRTITHAFKIVLPDGELPKVKGSDDADKARWVPIAELDSSVCYEDHYEIIQHFVGA
jgi:bifunctional NMN adenylyltransferase/nudix hydrolase